MYFSFLFFRKSVFTFVQKEKKNNGSKCGATAQGPEGQEKSTAPQVENVGTHPQVSFGQVFWLRTTHVSPNTHQKRQVFSKVLTDVTRSARCGHIVWVQDHHSHELYGDWSYTWPEHFSLFFQVKQWFCDCNLKSWFVLSFFSSILLISVQPEKNLRL